MANQWDFDSIIDVMTNPGRVVIDPTDITTIPFPFGGTSLGQTEEGTGFELEIDGGLEPSFTEEMGKEPTKLIIMGMNPKIHLRLVETKNKVLELAFLGLTSTGPSSGKTIVKYPGSNYAGKDMAGSGVGLLFVPIDETNGWCFYARKAVPEMLPTPINFNTKKIVWPVTFTCMRASGNNFELSPLEDITL